MQVTQQRACGLVRVSSPPCLVSTVITGVIAHPPDRLTKLDPPQQEYQCLTLALALTLARLLHNKKRASADKGGV